MKTVNEVSSLTGVSIRTLHYYDSIGLLKPTRITEAGYRLYDDTALCRLQSILLFRELKFPLKEIADIIDNPEFDSTRAIGQQIRLLELQKEHIDAVIALAREIQITGVNTMNFSAFDTAKIDEYAEQARKQWGNTAEYAEYERKNADKTAAQQGAVIQGLMDMFRRFGEIKELAPEGTQAQALAAELRAYITDNFYTCTKEILASLAVMYNAGGEMTENIDKAGGAGTADFAARAIAHYCSGEQR